MKKKHLLNLMIGSLSISSVVMVSVITSCGSKDSDPTPPKLPPDQHLPHIKVNATDFKDEQYTKKTNIGPTIMPQGDSIQANVYENESFKYVFDKDLFPKAGSDVIKKEWDVKFAQQLNNTLLQWGPGNFFNKLNNSKSTIIFKSSDSGGYSLGGSYLEVMLKVPSNAWTKDTIDADIEGYVGLTFHEVGHQNNAFSFYLSPKIGQTIQNNAKSTLDDLYGKFSEKITQGGQPDSNDNAVPNNADSEYIKKLFGGNKNFEAIWNANKNTKMIENRAYVTSPLEIATRIMESLSYVDGSDYTYTSPYNLPDREPLFVKHWFDVEIFNGNSNEKVETNTLNSGFKEFVEENLGFYAQKPVAQLTGYNMNDYDPSSTDKKNYALLAFNSKSDSMAKIEVIKSGAVINTYTEKDILNSEVNLPIKKFASSISNYYLDTWKYSGIRILNEQGYSYRAFDTNGKSISIESVK